MRKAIIILVLGASSALGSQEVTKAEAKQAKADFAAQQTSQRANKRAEKRFAKNQRKAMKQLKKGGKVKVQKTRTRTTR